jgi:midasin (ATPase involved in ribosome maturation)
MSDEDKNEHIDHSAMDALLDVLPNKRVVLIVVNDDATIHTVERGLGAFNVMLVCKVVVEQLIEELKGEFGENGAV